MQTLIVGLIVLAALGFIGQRGYRMVRSMRGSRDAGCGGDCGCGPS